VLGNYYLRFMLGFIATQELLLFTF